MIINLVLPCSQRNITYDINFPCTLPFPDLPCPAAWSAQSSLLTSVFRLENASNIHVFDKAVGLAARIREVELDIPRKEIQVTFIDGRSAEFAMNPDCARMLESVADDVRAFNDVEGQRSSLESSACASTTSSTDDLHSLNKGSSPRLHKSVKHKRQRSLLFSLISSLVPRTLSLSPRSSSPSGAVADPPQASLPPSLATPSGMDSFSHQEVFSPRTRNPISFLRTRARATLVDACRRHVLPALTLSVHVPPGGYIEWVLHGLVANTHAEVHEAQNGSPHVYARKAKHGRSRSEGRNALDLGERADAERLSCSPSMFSSQTNSEEGEDRVVYPRRDHANEWGVRVPSHSPDGLDSYIFELSCAHESLTEESFGYCDDPYEDAWDDNDRFTFDVDRPDSPSMLHGNGSSAVLSGAHVHFADGFWNGYREETTGFGGLAFTGPVVPSDVNEDDDSDESQPSPRTPEDGEELPLSVPPPARPTIETQQLIPVTKAVSSRPRSRGSPPPEPVVPKAQDVSAKPQSRIHFSKPSATNNRRSIAAWSPKARPRTQGLSTDEFIAMRLEYLRRVYDALNLVHVRSQEEGWRIVRASIFGGPTSWTEGDADRALEMKAKRRAWSSGLKIAAPYIWATYRSSPTLAPDPRSECFSEKRVWDGKLQHSPPPRSTRNEYGGNTLPLRPPGLPALPPKIRGPIVPTGLSLGKPLRSSPLARYVWTARDLELRQGRYGELSLRRIPESLVLDKLVGPGMSCVSFPESPTRTIPESPTRLFPVCEDSEEEGEVTLGSSVDPTTQEEIHSDEKAGLISEDCVTVTAVESPVEGMIASVNSEDDPFHFSPMRPRTRTTSMYSPSTSASLVLRPLTPPPSYQAAVSGDDTVHGSQTVEDGQDVKFDASSILLRPISSLSTSSAPSTPLSSATQHVRRPPLTSNPPYVPQSRSQSAPRQYSGMRRRSISLPAALSLSFLAPLMHSPSNIEKQTRAPSPGGCIDNEKCNRDYEDLSQAYISPPPLLSGPIIVSAVPAPHEQERYPRYAHVAQVVHATTPTVRRVGMPTINAGMGRAGRMDKRSVSEPESLYSAMDVNAYGKGGMKGGVPGNLDGSVEDAVEVGGCELALGLGRAEEGRVVW
ncbi:hypothetical protein BKA82DRAFT_4198173 [Pisolithus tinctorius]|nr:hypothetical protein BKA82DRAFT_4198173 [Pisolithus tinctorius]